MKSILLISGEPDGNSALTLALMKEKYGEEIVLVTLEEAIEKGLKMEDFANIPTMKITAPPIIPMMQTDFKSGKENRRQRREQERKTNKKRK